MNPAPIVPVLPAYKRRSDGHYEPRDVVVTLNTAVYIERFDRGEPAVIFRWRMRRWSPMVW